MNGLNLSEVSDIRLGSNTINALYYGSTLLWPSTPRDYSKEYLTIEALTDSTVLFNKNSNNISRTIQYSKDKNTWNTISFVHPSGDITESSPVSLLAGEKLYLKGNNSSYGTTDGGFCRINIHKGSGNIYGNIMSLIYGDNFYGQTVLDTPYLFNRLFNAAFHNNIIDASNLILPTTLSYMCYAGLFSRCEQLTGAPELPATTLATNCYFDMFNSCTSLTTAPELPATTLATGCYSGMFAGCTSLTTAPKLPAKTLPPGSSTNGCYDNMFNGCTSLTAAPELPATVLTGFAYWVMFKDCKSLRYIKCLATDIDALWCTRKWLEGVSSTGTFIKNPSMTWPTGTDGIPSGWTVQDAS